jgi:hypothetical protein
MGSRDGRTPIMAVVPCGILGGFAQVWWMRGETKGQPSSWVPVVPMMVPQLLFLLTVYTAPASDITWTLRSPFAMLRVSPED